MNSRFPVFSLAQLRQFVLVAELGSYTEAAARTHRTQSALSLAIRQMEQHLGQRLFEQNARTTLTPFGEQCIPLARALIKHHERAAEMMLHLAAGQVGKLTIACVATAFRILLAHLLPKFSALYPEIGVSIVDYNSFNVERAVLSYEADFGLGRKVSNDDRLTFIPLFTDAFGVVCPRSHHFAARDSIAWEELEGLSLIGSPAHNPLVDFPAAKALRSCKHQASHMAPMITMLEQGMGITVLSSSSFSTSSQNLCYVPLVEPAITVDLGFTKLSGRTLPRPAALMEQIILDSFLGP